MLKGYTFDENLDVPSWADGALYSMLLSKETGIWNMFEKCDVTAPIDYDTTAGFATIKFNKGAISVNGRALFIDQNTEFKVPLTATSTGSIGVRIDLSKPVTEQYEFYSKTTQSLVQEDLNDNRLGKYEFEIFKYTSTGGSITLSKQQNYIEPLSEILDTDGKTAKLSNIANIANYASADISKGTIEERLTSLGFKSGSVTLNSTALSSFPNSYINYFKQGNYVYLKVLLTVESNYNWGTLTNLNNFSIAQLPSEIIPKTTILANTSSERIDWTRNIVGSTYVCKAAHSFQLRITASGEIFISGDSNNNISNGWSPATVLGGFNTAINVGYDT